MFKVTTEIMIRKGSSYCNNIPICTKDLQMKKLQKNYRVQEESSR